MTDAPALDLTPVASGTRPLVASGLDPRTKMLLVVVVSTVVMSPYGPRFVLPGLVLAVAMAVSERAWRRAWVMPVLVVGGLLGVWALSQVPASPLTSSLLMTCEYTSRFTVAIGVGLHLFTTTSPSALNAALRTMRFPRSAAVTLVVMIRFLPVVMKESSAVFDAMRLRGLTRPAALLRHPLLTIERFTVPMIASSLRASEDLSAAAILRGLGSYHRPTALTEPRFSWIDGAWLLAATALATSAYVIPAALA
ncbi:MAG: energy-coupling factor transporter transmembrane component T [Dermatophilaceae bacterium]